MSTEHEQTFDEELLLWLGDEPPPVRAADAERIRDIAAEFARGFDALAGVGDAVTVFGSARTPEDHPDYALAREVGACLGWAGYAVITGGGPRALWPTGGSTGQTSTCCTRSNGPRRCARSSTPRASASANMGATNAAVPAPRRAD